MYNRITYVLSIILLIYQNVVDGKKHRTVQSTEIENAGPQPDVLTYSTFGFNDVRPYDGFVPTSPDYANFLNKYKETSEKLYAPAFPSAPDNDFSSSSQIINDVPFAADDTEQQSSMLHYNTANIYDKSFKFDDKTNTNSASDVEFRQGTVDNNNNNPVYGTKISPTNKKTTFTGYNDTAISSASYQNDNNYSNLEEPQTSNDNRPVYFKSVKNQQKNINDGMTDFQTVGIDNSINVPPVHSLSLLKFPKVLDFTHAKPHDLMETENKYSAGTTNTLDTFNSMDNTANDSKQKFHEEQSNKKYRISLNYKKVLENKETDSNVSQQTQNSYQDFYNVKSPKNKKFNYEYKDEIKVKPWKSETLNNDKIRLKNTMKGYDYASNISSTNFKFDANEPKKLFDPNTDEIISSGSNNIDFSNYQFPQNDYTKFRTKPHIKNVNNVFEDNESAQNMENTFNPSLEHLNKFKHFYGSTPTTSTNWGNIFKTTDYSSYKTHISKPNYNEEVTYDTVHIPKRPNNYRYEKNSDNAEIAWSEYSKKHSKFNTPNNEWNKENINTRFKSEEDLLGLRNHDTSHPSYLPIFQYGASDNSDDNFKTTVEKWREDYIKSKYRESPNFDYDASEAKRVHPVNPYQIEVPHPVIVPVPQPYPVHVPIPKPVAVPIVQEITVPIEKPVPYPVYKNTPYPVEKLVPVPVVKQVPVPVVKPYAVPVPQMRPVFHHSRPYRDEHEFDADHEEIDDYLPRPESSNVVYNKKPKRLDLDSIRNRLRRPSRMPHQERSKGRRPLRRPTSSRERDQYHYVKPTDYHRYRYRDSDSDEEQEYRDYLLYCKRTGKC